MIRELWGSFPRLLEQNINGLLDGAMPNPTKAFQLYRMCKHEDLWQGSFEKFSKCLEEFFSRPKFQRRKSDFDVFLARPMHSTLYADFHLNFRTAVVNETEVLNLASWAHHLLRVSKKTVSAVISLDVMTQTLRYITNPPPFEKARDIEFEDFCSAWKKTVFKLFGRQHDRELNEIVNELQWLNTQLKEEESDPRRTLSFPTIHMTQTEIEWTTAVRKAAEERLQKIPKFPLSRGPQKQFLVELQRVISLYEIVLTTNLPELLQHRENVRITLLDRCDRLLGEAAGGSGEMAS